MNKYKDYYVSPKTIVTAVFEYLERRKIKVNRRGGCISAQTIGGFQDGGWWEVKVKIKEK